MDFDPDRRLPIIEAILSVVTAQLLWLTMKFPHRNTKFNDDEVVSYQEENRSHLES